MYLYVDINSLFLAAHLAVIFTVNSFKSGFVYPFCLDALHITFIGMSNILTFSYWELFFSFCY